MREKESLLSEEMQEEMGKNAEVEAAADISAGDKGNTDINDSIPYVVPLSKTYDFEGASINEVDLSGLEDMSTTDGEYIDRVMSKMNYHPKDKFRDITYTKHIAMHITGLPVEFFNSLKWKDMQAITARISIYFLF